jgi:uncharacterized coiled-coil DUF342 family protein
MSDLKKNFSANGMCNANKSNCPHWSDTKFGVCEHYGAGGECMYLSHDENQSLRQTITTLETAFNEARKEVKELGRRYRAERENANDQYNRMREMAEFAEKHQQRATELQAEVEESKAKYMTSKSAHISAESQLVKALNRVSELQSEVEYLPKVQGQ